MKNTTNSKDKEPKRCYQKYHVRETEKMNHWYNTLLECIFPSNCLGCGLPSTLCCKECFKTIVPISHQLCPVCYKPHNNGLTHTDCKKHTCLDFLWVCCVYEHNLILQKLIKNLKYKGNKNQTPEIIQNIFKKCLPKDFSIKAIHVPVPLHPKRKRWRGFNQSEIIVRCLQKISPNLKIDTTLLKRVRYTQPQVKAQSRLARKNNLKDCFMANKNNITEPIILVDDICSTGTTLNECAKTLKRAGAANVGALVLARNVPHVNEPNMPL